MNTVIFAIILIPIVEIYLFIKLGSQIGAFNTISLIFITAIIGVYFAKLQGIQTLKSGMINLYQNKMPVYEMISGASIAIAAFLLIFPGFLTDFIGFMLLIPLTRKLIFNLAFKNKTEANINSNNKTIDGEVVDKKKDEL